jgi:hypothetical protein
MTTNTIKTLDLNDAGKFKEIIINGTPKKYAFIVLLFGGDGYVPGAITVAKALRLNHDHDGLIYDNSQWIVNLDKGYNTYEGADLIVFVTGDVSLKAKTILGCFFDYVIDIEYIQCDTAVADVIKKDKPHYTKVWTKFHMLRLTQYQKVCLLDADYLPYQSMRDLFDLPTPAAYTEVPVSFDEKAKYQNLTFSPEWTQIFHLCCSHGKSIPGIIPMILLYLNKTELSPLSPNFMYGGVNASILLLKPDIVEFNDIMHDLNTYNPTRIKFYYPEQQYLTLRYAFGSSIRSKEMIDIVKDFMNFIRPNFPAVYKKLEQLNFNEIYAFSNTNTDYVIPKEIYDKNITDLNAQDIEDYFFIEESELEKYKLKDTIGIRIPAEIKLNSLKFGEKLAIPTKYKHNLFQINNLIDTKTKYTTEHSKIYNINYKQRTLQIMMIVIMLLNKCLIDHPDILTSNIGPWTSIGLEYFITEYYKDLPEKTKWKGFPIFQQKKIWDWNKYTVKGVERDPMNEPKSLGFDEWYNVFDKVCVDLKNTVYQDKMSKIVDLQTMNLINEEIQKYEEMIKKYKIYEHIEMKIAKQQGGINYKKLYNEEKLKYLNLANN